MVEKLWSDVLKVEMLKEIGLTVSRGYLLLLGPFNFPVVRYVAY